MITVEILIGGQAVLEANFHDRLYRQKGNNKKKKEEEEERRKEEEKEKKSTL
jgi:hypothetical protein